MTVDRQEYARKWRAANKDKLRAYARKHYAKNKEKRRAYMVEYRKTHPEMQRTATKKWRNANREKHRAYKRKYERGQRITNPNKVRAKDRRRRGLPNPTRPCPAVCECCGGTGGRQAIGLDHCHETNDFRGWLCWRCNAAIGMLGDTLDGVQNAFDYLRRAHEQPACEAPVAQIPGPE